MPAIGFIGLGEVGSCYSSGLAQQGLSILGYDLKLGLKEFASYEQRCAQNGVKFTADNEELVAQSDWVFAVTTCAQTVETAEIAARYLRPEQYYVDFNSSIPSVKKEAQAIIEATGASFCDACTINTPLRNGLRCKIAICGEKAQEIANYCNQNGMNMRVLGPNIGKAAAYKVIRSIYMKGSEALLLETIAAARKMGILDEIWGAIRDVLSKDAPGLFDTMVRAGAIHSLRRAHEIGDVARMLKELDMDCTMASAAFQKLMWYNDLGVKDYFSGQIPDHVDKIADFLLNVDTVCKGGN